MSEPLLADMLGMVAGGVWMTAALYFQLIRTRSVHPAYVSALFLIGVALMMGSATLTLVASPGLAELLGIVANVIFIALGCGVWVALEKSAALHDRQNASDTHSHTR